MKIFPAMSQGGETHSKRDCARFDSVAGSHAPLAQLAEPPICNRQVGSSTLSGGTNAL